MKAKQIAKWYDERPAVLTPQAQRQAVGAGQGRMEHKRAGSFSYEKWTDGSLLSSDKISLVGHTYVFAVSHIVRPGRFTSCPFDLFSLDILDCYFNLLL